MTDKTDLVDEVRMLAQLAVREGILWDIATNVNKAPTMHEKATKATQARMALEDRIIERLREAFPDARCAYCNRAMRRENVISTPGGDAVCSQQCAVGLADENAAIKAQDEAHDRMMDAALTKGPA